MINEIGGLIVNQTAKCQACQLGDRSLLKKARYARVDSNDVERSIGMGERNAPIFFLSDSTRHVDGHDGPFGIDRLDREDVFAAWEDPFLLACKLAGLSRRDMYVTTAIKCPFVRGVNLPEHIQHNCLEHHLGPELETIQPRIIWSVAYYGTRMISSHFRGMNIPNLSCGQAFEFNAPNSWSRDTVLFVKTHHPKNKKTKFFDLKEEIAFIGDYLRSCDDI